MYSKELSGSKTIYHLDISEILSNLKSEPERIVKCLDSIVDDAERDFMEKYSKSCEQNKSLSYYATKKYSDKYSPIFNGEYMISIRTAEGKEVLETMLGKIKNHYLYELKHENFNDGLYERGSAIPWVLALPAFFLSAYALEPLFGVRAATLLAMPEFFVSLGIGLWIDTKVRNYLGKRSQMKELAAKFDRIRVIEDSQA